MASDKFKSVPDYLRYRDKSRSDDSIKIEFEGRKITKKEYWDKIEQYKHMFKERGIIKGRAVTICNLNTPEYEFIYIALLDLGVIVSPVSIKFITVDMYKQTLERGVDTLIISSEFCSPESPYYTQELKKAFEDFQNYHPNEKLTEIIFTSAGRYRSEKNETEYEGKFNFREDIANLNIPLKETPIILPEEFKDMVEYQPTTFTPSINLMDCVATYSNTGGTTGEPKCAYHNHRNIIALMQSHEPSVFKHFTVKEETRVFVFIPFSHITGQFYNVLVRRAAGGNLIYNPDVFRDYMKIMPVLMENKINDWVGPFGLYQLLAISIEQGKIREQFGPYALEHLFSNVCGGEPTPISSTMWVNSVLESVGAAKINIGTGSTEAGSGYMASYGYEGRTNESGYFFPGAKGFVMNPLTGKKANDGDYGIFFFNSPWNMQGYRNDIEATNRFFSYTDPDTGELYGTNLDIVRVVGEFEGNALHEMSGRDTDFIIPTSNRRTTDVLPNGRKYTQGIYFDKNGNILPVDLKKGNYLFEMRDEFLNIPGVLQAQALLLPESSNSKDGYPVVDVVLAPNVSGASVIKAAYNSIKEKKSEFKPAGVKILTHFEQSPSTDKREVISLCDLRDDYITDKSGDLYKISFPEGKEPTYEKIEDETEIIAVPPPPPRKVYSRKDLRK